MKLSPHDQKVTDRMAPGVYSRDGFLGSDTRPLAVILDMDNSTLADRGVTHEQIGARLASILEQARAGFGTPIDVGPGLKAHFIEAMGRIPSPFGDGVFPKGEVELQTDDGRVYRFTPLSVHMITHHGFYQGKGSRYRLEPAELVDLLGLGGQED